MNLINEQFLRVMMTQCSVIGEETIIFIQNFKFWDYYKMHIFLKYCKKKKEKKKKIKKKNTKKKIKC